METTTDAQTEHVETVSGFYDGLAATYDGMTGFEQRFVHEHPFFRIIVERYNIATALDAGCGTGFHSLLLTELGVHVTAVDISRPMLECLLAHARERHASVEAVQSDLLDLRGKISRSYDAVVSMGNTFAHLLTSGDMGTAVDNFYALLKPGGVAFVQMLNYDRILKRRERIQSIKETNGNTYVRFYDYAGDRVRFNILSVHRGADRVERKLSTVELHPWTSGELAGAFGKAGFSRVQLFGSIAMNAYDPGQSKDAVILAQKGETGR